MIYVVSIAWTHITANGSEENHRHHEAEENDNHDRVSKTEPVNFLVENMLCRASKSWATRGKIITILTK